MAPSSPPRSSYRRPAGRASCSLLSLRLTWRLVVERFIGVEEARDTLGRLVEEVAASGEPISLTRRGRPLAVLMGREEYARLRLVATQQARTELATLLVEVRERVGEAGVEQSVIDAAIAASRRM